MVDSNTTHDLSVPYLVRLTGAGIQPGQIFKIQGVPTGDKFEVCFIAGSNVEQNDLPVIVDVNQKDDVIIFNDRKNGQLGKQISKNNPFKRNEPIDLRFRLHEDRLQVLTNLKNFAEFEYRQTLTSITHVNIGGAINLTNVSWGGKYYPVPYQADIEGNFGPGRKLFVLGMPEKKQNHKNAAINLLNANGDYVFHCSIRFNNKHVVLNSKLNGQWGNEEVIKNFPFHSDTAFDVMIVNEEHSYQVFVNGQHLCSYAHRADSRSIDRLLIENDIELYGVHVT